jgi:two-component system NarL family sensor kinase
VQEAVTNSIKHAGAKNISVNSDFQKDAWKLTISDDGKGFNYKETKNATAGNGLNNMKQRAIDAGFNLTFESADNGTIISIFV